MNPWWAGALALSAFCTFVFGCAMAWRSGWKRGYETAAGPVREAHADRTADPAHSLSR